MENKNNDKKKIWDYVYKAVIGNEFIPGPYKITLSRGKNELEFDGNSGYLSFSTDFTAMVLDLDTPYDEFLEYVTYRFGIDKPKQ